MSERLNLTTLLAPVSRRAFFGDHFCRFPLAIRGTALDFCPLATWAVLDRLLAQPDADIMVVGTGDRYSGPAPQSAAEARNLTSEGYTIVVRHAEQHDPDLNRLAAEFAADLLGETDIHLYVTPPGTHGFAWHYDAEDVFIVQCAGRKHYALRKNTVHPWPLVETLPENMQFECEKTLLMNAELHAGDWLYIPCGYWHQADALQSPDVAFSLAIGVLPPTAIDLYDFLRSQLCRSVVWRCRLPLSPNGSPAGGGKVDAAIRDAVKGLAHDLQCLLCDVGLLEAFFATRPGHTPTPHKLQPATPTASDPARI